MKTKMNQQNRFLVATFKDGSKYKIPLAQITGVLAVENATNGDITLSEALKQAESCPDYSLIKFARSLEWYLFDQSAKLIGGSGKIKKKFGFKTSDMVIMSEEDVNKIQVQINGKDINGIEACIYTDGDEEPVFMPHFPKDEYSKTEAAQ